MSSCATVTRDGAVVTSYSTSSYVATTISTQPGSTVATSSPVVVTSCPAGGTGEECATSTSYSLGETVLPGSTVTVSRTLPTVVAVVSTAPGSVQTFCEAPTSTTSSSPSASSTTSAPAPSSPRDEPSSSTTVVTTTLTSRIGDDPSTSFVRSTTTISAPSSSSDTDVAGASRIASTPTTESSSPSSSTPEFVTSYRTIIVTSIDSSGRTSIWESAVPTLLNAAHSSGSGGASTGAIAGGVVGGVAALVLAAVVFWLMRKKGYFRRGDEEFEEDVWAPRPHSQFYAAGAGKGGGGGGGAGGSGNASAEGSGDDKLDALSEKEQAIDAATLERHRSWYNSMGGRSGRNGGAGGSAEGGEGLDDPELMTSMDEVYGGMVQRAPSPGAEAALAAAAGGAGGLAVGGAPPRRSLSNRLSVYSGSSHSHSHDGAGSVGYSPHSFVAPPLPPVPDHRLSLQHGYFQNFGGGGEHYQEELGPYRAHSPPAGVLPYLRPRSASPPPMQPSPLDYPSSHPYPHPYAAHNVSRRPSFPALSAAAAIPPHLRSESYGSSSSSGAPPRPSPEALQGGGGGGSAYLARASSSSSSSYYGSTTHGHQPAPSTSSAVTPVPQRVETTDSFSSGSSSSYPATSRPTTSGSSSARHVTPPSTAAPTAASSPYGGDGKLDLAPPPPPLPPLPVMPSIERLKADEGISTSTSNSSSSSNLSGNGYPKRPGFDRAASSESFIYVPSQWLGARVVNADAVTAETETSSVVETLGSSLRRRREADESVDSLGLAKGAAAVELGGEEEGEVAQREVVVDPSAAGMRD
ncbi:hypothetical protein JCM6882_004210 [Rhodosporidiobolus microsporus]